MSNKKRPGLEAERERLRAEREMRHDAHEAPPRREVQVAKWWEGEHYMAFPARRRSPCRHQ